MEVESWISKSVNRYWGRIIENRNKKNREMMAELAKQTATLNKKEEVMEAENKAIEEELDYPLEISFK